MSDVPPIPAALAHRPTVGGLVQPWLNVALADGGVDFRAQHQSRAAACWTRGLCQVCGNPLRPPAVLLGGPKQLRRLMFDEPPLHPECCLYTSQACPMVSGRTEYYADRPVLSSGHRGKTCATPGCDCGGWVPTPGVAPAQPAADPAHEWFAVWVRGFSPAAMHDSPQHITHGVVRPADVIRVVLVSRPGEGRVWHRLDLAAALADYDAPRPAAGPP
ncbi:hypothetical protein GCM10009613_60790 [Pseudonocardia kongjuensis]|uniref:TniQ protein n=1 Tax=Pseudonocardia kongjuensis TaxID=102227 RepID=A0ABN1YAQ4_9PSEU